MWELDHKEGWMPKNWCFWAVVLEKTLESPLDCKEVKSVHPKGHQSWIFIRRTDAETEAQYFGHLTRRADTLEKIQCWEGLKAGGEGDDRGQDGWMASLTQWTWVWTSYGKLWRTGKPAVLQSMACKESGMTEPWTIATMYLKSDFLCFWDQDVKDAQPEWNKAREADSLLTIVTCLKGTLNSTQNCIFNLRTSYSAISLTSV